MTHVSFGESLIITAFAMSFVFILLLFLSIVIKIQTHIIDSIDKKRNNKKQIAMQPKEVKEHKQKAAEEVDINKEYETVAAIMAALSSYINVPVEKLNIKSIKRVDNNLWRQTSLRDSLK